MGQISLLVCYFLVITGTAAIASRQLLRSELVYDERNHKEGRYKYGYAVRRGESQFHHQRSLDGAMYGCYGYVDPRGKLFITHYLADMAGYRLVNMANPDKTLIERIKNRSSPENPIDLQDLFPAECHKDGDIKTLQQMASEMQASLSSQEALAPESRHPPSYDHRSGITSERKSVDSNHIAGSDSIQDQFYEASDRDPIIRKASRTFTRADDSEDKVKPSVRVASHTARGNGRYKSNRVGSSSENGNREGAASTGDVSVTAEKTADEQVTVAVEQKTTPELQSVPSAPITLEARRNNDVDSQLSSTNNAAGSESDEIPHPIEQKTVDEGETQTNPAPMVADEVKSESSTSDDKDVEVAELIASNVESDPAVLNVETTTDKQEENEPEVVANAAPVDHISETTVDKINEDAQELTPSNEPTTDAVPEIAKVDDQTADAVEPDDKPMDSTKDVSEPSSDANEQTTETLAEKVTDRSESKAMDDTEETVKTESTLEDVEHSKIERTVGADIEQKDKPESITEQMQEEDRVITEQSLDQVSQNTPAQEETVVHENSKDLKVDEGPITDEILEEASEHSPAQEKPMIGGDSTPLTLPSYITIGKDSTKTNPSPRVETSSKPSFEIVKSILVYEYTEDGDFAFTDPPQKSNENGVKIVTEVLQPTTTQSLVEVKSPVVIGGSLLQIHTDSSTIFNRPKFDQTKFNQAKPVENREVFAPKIEQSTTPVLKNNDDVLGTPTDSSKVTKPKHSPVISVEVISDTPSVRNTDSRENSLHPVLDNVNSAGNMGILVPGIQHSSTHVPSNDNAIGTQSGSHSTVFKPKLPSLISSLISGGPHTDRITDPAAKSAGNKEGPAPAFLHSTTHSTVFKPKLPPFLNLPVHRVTNSERTTNPVVKPVDKVSPIRVDKPFFNRNSVDHPKVAIADKTVSTGKQPEAPAEPAKTRKGAVSRGRVRYADYANGQKKSTEGVDNKVTTARGQPRRTKVEASNAEFSKVMERKVNNVILRNELQNVKVYIGQANKAAEQKKNNVVTEEPPKIKVQNIEISKTAQKELAQTDELSKTEVENDGMGKATEDEERKVDIPTETKMQIEEIRTEPAKPEPQNTSEHEGRIGTGSRRIDIRKDGFKSFFVYGQDDSLAKKAGITEASGTNQQKTDSFEATDDSLENAESDRSHLAEFAKPTFGSNTIELGIIIVPEEHKLAPSDDLNEIKTNVEVTEPATEPTEKPLDSESVPKTDDRMTPVSIPEYVLGGAVSKKLSLLDNDSQNLLMNQETGSETGTGEKLEVKGNSDKTPIRLVIPLINSQDYRAPEKKQITNAKDSMITRILTFPKHSQPQDNQITADAIEPDQRAVIPKLPATPRSTTVTDSEPTTVHYELAIRTDRVPVTPHPTTFVRPVTSSYLFQATTPSVPLRSGTTIGPNGDIYDEVEEDSDPPSSPNSSPPSSNSLQTPSTPPASATFPAIPGIGTGVTIQPSASCYEITLNLPIDAKQVLVRTDSSAFRVFGSGDPNERIKLIEPGVYEVNVGATSSINFKQYQHTDQQRANANHIDTPLEINSVEPRR